MLPPLLQPILPAQAAPLEEAGATSGKLPREKLADLAGK